MLNENLHKQVQADIIDNMAVVRSVEHPLWACHMCSAGEAVVLTHTILNKFV